MPGCRCGARSRLCPVRRNVVRVQTGDAIRGRMAVGIGVSRGDDAHRRPRRGEPRFVGAVGTTVMMDFGRRRGVPRTRPRWSRCPCTCRCPSRSGRLRFPRAKAPNESSTATLKSFSFVVGMPAPFTAYTFRSISELVPASNRMDWPASAVFPMPFHGLHVFLVSCAGVAGAPGHMPFPSGGIGPGFPVCSRCDRSDSG